MYKRESYFQMYVIKNGDHRARSQAMDNLHTRLKSSIHLTQTIKENKQADKCKRQIKT